MTPAADLSPGDIIRGGPGVGVIDLVEVTPKSDGWVHLRWGWGPGDTRFVPADSKFMVVGKFEAGAAFARFEAKNQQLTYRS